MAYSGTVGQTVVSVQDLIDHGARRSGKLAEELTSEQIYAAKQSLFFLLSNLSNIGINYWAIGQKVFGLKAEQFIYELPLGSIDVLNANYRTMNRPTPNATGGYFSSAGGQVANAFDSDVDTKTVQTSINGNLSINYGDFNPVYAGSIGILPGVSGDFHILLEVSSDGSTWTLLEDTGVTTWVDNKWIWYQIEPGANQQWYRMRETGGNTLQVREFYVGNMSREVPMARLNRDDYTSLPNKNFTANQPYQFWFNRTIPRPQITLWPAPSDPFVQMVVWYSRQVMDVGALDGQLEIPDRWYLAVQNMLAHQMAMELPGVDLARVQYLEVQAEKYLNLAESEERDKSPIYLAPNISVYTR
jgi:hypothetical protein